MTPNEEDETVKTMTHSRDALIDTAARKIAGCSWEDRETTGSITDQLNVCRDQLDHGSDGDLTLVDRMALDTLIGLSEGEKFSLHNLKTGDYIRPATDDEVCASAVAQTNDGGHGAIEVDGESCYVE